MNKLFKKLADEAFFDEASSITSDIMYKFSDHKMQKFAELIVKECARIIMNGGYWTDILGNRKNASPDEIAQMIKEHFGVEE